MKLDFNESPSTLFSFNFGNSVDASDFNIVQLKWVKERYPVLFSKLNFALVYDSLVYALFPARYVSPSQQDITSLPAIPIDMKMSQRRALSATKTVIPPKNVHAYRCLGVNKAEFLEGIGTSDIDDCIC